MNTPRFLPLLMKSSTVFYGNLKSERDIEIKDACQEVFQTMIEFIYNKNQSTKILTSVSLHLSTTLQTSMTY